MAGLIYKELWHDPKTCEWAAKWSSDIGWLWVKLISFADDHPKLRGLISELQVTTVCALNHIPQGAIEQLVEAKGLDLTEGGYRIHNYRKRGDLFRARSDAGKKGAAKRWQKPMATEIANSHKQSAWQNNGVGDGDVEEIFSTWKESTGKNAQLLPERRRLIRAALKSYPKQDVLDAVRGWKNDTWPERPNRTELKYLIGDGEKIEKFRDLWRNGCPVAAVPESKGTSAARLLLEHAAVLRAS